ncbi:MAG: glycogen/starch/alpha-glucan family phosphorylase [Lachnospiraceae bacterium]|uniref:Alpha-1,4 glucan phosphorylase n=1 Tax=Roseburia porci TaxID=2605790 RepID=A0A6L5YU16_9FIRM|nr:glycogen/starch/alpha-glucan phosphorylase [Roseburia porci]MCI5877984.1 glycogen/starch/alpha-glucan family phosphorylase [Lachnospiraceae bacterium]MDD6742906.1 glycogen/starch/alpha-glucan phosphorylase [Roseburia porci]MST75894.1 glycogen/starch/alpha-glucan phosphorylase [Roseburia porci]
MTLAQAIENKYHRGIAECSNEEIYYCLLEMTKKMAEDKISNDGKKKLYYISAEFLIGKLLSNNLINLGIYEDIKKELADNGKAIGDIEEIELEPSLGNGGLGRLAACFMDSVATLGLNGDGVGLNYHYGLFKQVFDHNLQKETPNPWITDESWLTKSDISYTVQFGGFNVQSRLYDIDVVGYNNRTNRLRLFDIESVDESIVGDTIDFDKDQIAKNLTLFLYPDDSDEKGRLLRVYQQYFMVSNAARLVLDECVAKGSNLHDLADYAAIQINDTHPSMVIPELIRLLQERGIVMDEAIEIVSKVCAYTNHTILAEALEKWPIYFLEKAVPQLMPIIRELDNRVRQKVSDESTYIIKDGLVHMAHMDIHYGYSVNGVAYLHTEILKNTELNNFYKLYPERFNNKTNGITFRRWLMACNPELSAMITDLIGDGWKKDANELEKLANFMDDDAVLDRLLAVKSGKKADLKNYLKATQGMDIDDNSIYDIQIKRLHEYKRQQMNALYIIHKYFEIKEGKKPARPITLFFGAKAAPAYVIAKDIIHLILCLQQIINNDPEVSPYLKVFMVENYNVTLAEKLIPACDISEQISLASKEASGTGNMKFMLNGALTLGTMDGANVEIAELVGEDNIYTFGESSETVIARYERGDYCSKDYYEKDAALKKAVDFIVSDQVMAVGCRENLERLYNELLNKDWFMTFPDFESYVATKERAYADYEDRKTWAKKVLLNISKAGFFSSDRTIAQYNDEIWKLN